MLLHVKFNSTVLYKGQEWNESETVMREWAKMCAAADTSRSKQESFLNSEAEFRQESHGEDAAVPHYDASGKHKWCVSTHSREQQLPLSRSFRSHKEEKERQYPQDTLPGDLNQDRSAGQTQEKLDIWRIQNKDDVDASSWCGKMLNTEHTEAIPGFQKLSLTILEQTWSPKNRNSMNSIV